MHASWLLFGCYAPAHERAERDRAVGRERAGELSLTVSDGLAAVREASDDRVVLWQSAPSIVVEVECSAPLHFSLQVHNVMSSALPISDSPELTVASRPSPSPKRRDAEVSCGKGLHRLRIGPPDAERARPFRFMLMSDVQEAIDRVSDLYRVMNEQANVDFLLGAGDLTQRGTITQLTQFEQELQALEVPYYTTLGNHELGVEPPAYHDHFGRGSFSFSHKGARFTLLDSASATVDPLVYEWLDRWLEAGEEAFHVVAMHIPPVDPIGVRNGSFASRAEANKLLQRLVAHDVDLTLYGHIHSYYSFQNAGVPAYISGGGGAIPERFDGVERHFLVFDVDPERQTYAHRIVDIGD